MSKYTVFLEDADACDAGVVGREAQHLHLLLENGVKVPQGFAVTAQALSDFLKGSGAGERIQHLLAGGEVDAKGLGILTRQAQEAVMTADLDWDIESELVGGYEHVARSDVEGSPKVTVVASVAFHPKSFPYFANTFERRSQAHDRHDLDRALKEAWASLFTLESLEYFDSIGWDLGDIRASVVVQLALSPEVSGVVVPTTGPGGASRLIIKAVLGSASALERGLIEPETVVVDLDHGSVVERQTPKQDSFLFPDRAGHLRPLTLTPDLAGAAKVPDEACAELARLERLAAKVFGGPMVLEWAIEGDSVWIVNAIPLSAVEGEAPEEGPAPEEAEPAVAMPPAAAAEVPPAETAELFTPVPTGAQAAPKPAAAAPSEEDALLQDTLSKLGLASKRRPGRAAKPPARAVPAPAPAPTPTPAPAPALARQPPTPPSKKPPMEPEAPALVEEAEEAPEEDADAEAEAEAESAAEAAGAGEAEAIEEVAPAPDEGPTAPAPAGGTEVLSPEALDLGPYLPVTEMQVLLATTTVERVKELSGVPVTGVLFDDTEYMLRLTEGRHPAVALEAEGERFIDSLAAGQVAMAVAVYPQPVYIRLSDLRSDTGRGLEGGEEREQEEAVPWMGFRGVGRLLSPAGEPLLRAEARALRRARRDRSMTNVHVIIPFPRTVEEVEALYNLLFEEGVRRSGNLRMYIDVSVPATLLFLHLYSQVSDGFFVRLDELLPALLSVDPTSERLRERDYLTAQDKAVRQALLLVTEAARQAKKEVIIETSHALDPRTLEFLLRIGISGLCLGPSGLRENVALISKVEDRLQGEERG